MLSTLTPASARPDSSAIDLSWPSLPLIHAARRMTFLGPKGTRDLYPPDIAVGHHIESAWRETEHARGHPRRRHDPQGLSRGPEQRPVQGRRRGPRRPSGLVPHRQFVWTITKRLCPPTPWPHIQTSASPYLPPRRLHATSAASIACPLKSIFRSSHLKLPKQRPIAE